MKEIDVRYGVEINFNLKGPGIYISGHNIEGAINIIRNTGNIYEEIKWKIIEILQNARESNASLKEIRSSYLNSKLSISFEFVFWENFLEFKKQIEELSL